MDLDLTRLFNVRFCLNSAKHFDYYDFEKQDVNMILNLIKQNQFTFRSLLDKISPFDNDSDDSERRKYIISLLKYLIYYGQIHINWNQPILDTNLDYSDNIPGLYNVGSKAACVQRIKTYCTELQMFKEVQLQYELRFGSYWDMFLCENGKLLWMLRSKDDDWYARQKDLTAELANDGL